MVVRRLGEKSPPEAARVSGQEATMSFSGPTDPPFTLPEPYPFKEQVIIDVMFPGQCGNTAFFFKSQPDQFHFEFRGIVFPGKSFFSAHEVSTCKISGCLSYRILDSGPDGTQTTLTYYLQNRGKHPGFYSTGCRSLTASVGRPLHASFDQSKY